jgi:hypothetical protein
VVVVSGAGPRAQGQPAALRRAQPLTRRHICARAQRVVGLRHRRLGVARILVAADQAIGKAPNARAVLRRGTAAGERREQNQRDHADSVTAQ